MELKWRDMTREIIFKGKKVDNGEWIEGCLFDNGMSAEKRMFIGKLVISPYEGTACDKWSIEGIDFDEVDPDTICEYTGLTDKNGNRIWENDICDRKEPYPEIVKMYSGDWTLDYSYVFGKEFGSSYCNLGFYVNERNCVEVKGNIFDNPELVKEG
jgi:uncharacterized phage protein (TIGR01671 family)